MKRALRRLVGGVARRTPGLRGLVAELQAARRAFAIPSGHFYSPIPALEELSGNADRLFGRWLRELAAIPLNEHQQLALLA